jgi:membrane protease YdiL (CAAX protease family)
MTEVNDVPRPPRRDLVVLLIALVLPSAITWVYFYGADSARVGVQLAVFNTVKVLQFVFPVAWVALVQRRRITLRPRDGRGIAAGLAFGALVAAAIFALYFIWMRTSPVLGEATDDIQDKVSDFGIDSVWKYAALGVFYSLCHSFLEEYYWRWFVFGELRRFTAVGPAVVISSLGFMAHHVLVLGKFFGFDHWATWLFSFCVAAGGAAWAWLYERTGSLVGPWLSHLLVDAAIFAVGFDIVRRSLTG